MAKETTKKTKSPKKDISDEQLYRSARSFEAIMLSQIAIGDKLGDDLKTAIRVGMIVLGLIALSILILLLTLSSQINRISGVVKDMDTNFTTVSLQMDQMSDAVTSMSLRVALLEDITRQTGSMHDNMLTITDDIQTMDSSVGKISQHVNSVRHNVHSISSSMNRVDDQVQMMSQDMQRMAQPARSMNKLFPMMP